MGFPVTMASHIAAGMVVVVVPPPPMVVVVVPPPGIVVVVVPPPGHDPVARLEFLLRYPFVASSFVASASRNFAQYCVPLTDKVTFASAPDGRGKAPPASPLLPLVSTFIL